MVRLTFKKVIQKDFFVLPSWVKTGFDFVFSAIDIKGLIKRVIGEQSFHLQGTRPAHVFLHGVKTVPSQFLPATKKIQQQTNNPPTYIIHFIRLV